MTIIIVSALSVINIILWIVFFHRFNRIFSTDDIIENTRSELNRMIGDVNRNTERDITLIEDRIRELKKIITEADQRMKIYTAEQKKKTMGKEYSSAIDKVISHSVSPVETPIQKAAGKYKKVAGQPEPHTSQKTVYSITPKGFKQTVESEQAELFTDPAAVKNDEASFVESPIPQYGPASSELPRVVMSDNPVVTKKNFNEKVQELYEKGETIENIASELSSSITEVQFAIDMNDQL